MKRVISLLLCLVMCVSVFTATATTVYASSVTDDIFTVEKTDFNNDRITYTISLKANQQKISGAILKFKYDSTVLEVSSGSGAAGSVNEYNEFAANVTGYYEKGIEWNDKNTYAVAYMNPNGFNIGATSKKFIKITFVAISDTRPVTDVDFYCEEFITDDGDDTNDIRKGDGAQKFYSDSFFTLSPAKNLEVASSETGLKFTWSAATGAEWYKVYRRQLKKDGSLSNWKTLAKVPAGTTEYVDETIEKGVEYYYSVETGNQFDKIEYDKEGLAGFFFGTITEMDATLTERGAKISWGALNGAESYSVHRNTDGETNANGELIWKKVGETDSETSYEDEPLTSGVKYSYTVKAHKDNYIAEASVAPEEILFIAGANIVGYKLNYDNIVINWPIVNGAVRYRIYRKAKGESEYTRIASTTKNSFTDTDVADKTTYYYKVRSVAENGDTSVLGAAYSVIKLPITTKVKATSVNDHITVSWNAAELAEEYIVYRKTATGNWMMITTVPATKTKFVDNSVKSGVAYVYAVASKAQSFTTEISKVSNQVFFLAAPKIVSVFNDSEGIELTFQNVEGAEKYNIYRRKASGQFGEPITTITQSTSKQYVYVDSKATSGVQYVYGVQSVYGETVSAIIESDVACCLDEPEIELEPVYTGIKIKWDKVSGAEKYEIYYSQSRKADSMELLTTVTGTSYIHKEAESGRKNYYWVKAVCGDTTSIAQDSIYYLAAPKIIEFKNYKSCVQLKWNDILGADEYIVYRKVYGEDKWTKINVELKYEEVKEGTDTITYVVAKDSNVTAGKKYVYTVVSGDGEDYSGKYEKGWSHRFLKNPTIKSVSNYYGGPKITWSKASGASKYYVYRKTKSTSWKYIGYTTNTYYVDKTAKSDTKYYYAVKSVNGDCTSYHSTSHFNDICKTVNYLAAPVVSVKNNVSTSITVSWGKVSGAEKYYVYRKAGSANSWTRVKTTTSTSYTDKDVKNGTAYKYMVKAVDGSILSGGNSEGEFIRRLAAPKASSVTSSKSGISFKWSKVSGVSGYYVYRKTGSGSYTKIATVKGSTKVSYFDKSAEKGKTYTYMVKAYYGSSTSAYNGTLKITDKY